MQFDTWIVAAGNSDIGNLVALARGLHARSGALVVGDEVLAHQIARSGVDEVVWIRAEPDSPVEAYAQAAGRFVQSSERMVLGGRHGAERVIVAAVAAASNLDVVVGVESIDIGQDGLIVRRGAVGGGVEETLSVTEPIAVIADGGSTVEDSGVDAPITEVTEAAGRIHVTGRHGSPVEERPLSSAKIVVGVGRGVKKAEDLDMIRDFATSIGAELACTRPLAEGLNWFPRDSYIGISGQQIAPDLYLAIGVSGQLQHMAGVRKAKTIIAINSDPHAPIVAQSDYAVTGDLYSVVPRLAQALNAGTPSAVGAHAK